jgi:hypothetical protein
MPRVVHVDDATDRIEEFLRTKDLFSLTNAVQFPRSTLYSRYLCCDGLLSCLATMCLSAFFCPVATLCPCWLAPHFSLSLDKDELHLTTATNDFWCACLCRSSNKALAATAAAAAAAAAASHPG